MKTHEIATVTATLLGTLLTGCAEPVPIETKALETETLERKVEAPAVLTSTAPPAAMPEPERVDEPQPKEVRSEQAFELEPDTEAIDGLTLVRFVTASQVEDREPAPTSSRFTTDQERIYAFVEAKNESDLAKTLVVHFIGPDRKVSGGIELEIPASVPRWRTWAYTRHARTPGLWRVEIRDQQGTLIGALPFEVESAP